MGLIPSKCLTPSRSSCLGDQAKRQNIKKWNKTILIVIKFTFLSWINKNYLKWICQNETRGVTTHFNNGSIYFIGLCVYLFVFMNIFYICFNYATTQNSTQISFSSSHKNALRFVICDAVVNRYHKEKRLFLI